MKKSAIFGMALLLVVWVWLVWGVLSSGPVTLLKLIMVAMSWVIVFVPLWRKYGCKKKEAKNTRHGKRG